MAYWRDSTTIQQGALVHVAVRFGQSEFLTVDSGLEFALGIVFLWPLFRPSEIAFPLLVCLIVHGCLALFRTAGFFQFSGIPATNYVFAVTESGIFFDAAFLKGMQAGEFEYCSHSASS